MKRKYLDKWIGIVTCQNILEALENDITEKKNFLQIYSSEDFATEDTGCW